MPVSLSQRGRFWRDHLHACRAQGGTLKAYAEKHQLSLTQLYHWSTRLRRQGVLDDPSPPGRGSHALVPVHIRHETGEGDHCRIDLPDGIRLNWPVAGDPRHLARILQALDTHG